MTRLSRLLEMLQSGPMTRRQIADAFGIRIENVSGLVQQGIEAGSRKPRSPRQRISGAEMGTCRYDPEKRRDPAELPHLFHTSLAGVEWGVEGRE